MAGARTGVFLKKLGVACTPAIARFLQISATFCNGQIIVSFDIKGRYEVGAAKRKLFFSSAIGV